MTHGREQHVFWDLLVFLNEVKLDPHGEEEGGVQHRDICHRERFTTLILPLRQLPKRKSGFATVAGEGG